MDLKTYCKLADIWNRTVRVRHIVHERHSEWRDFCELTETEQDAFRLGHEATMKVHNIRSLRSVEVKNKNGTTIHIEFAPQSGYRIVGHDGGHSLIAILYSNHIDATVGEYSELTKLSVCPYDTY